MTEERRKVILEMNSDVPNGVLISREMSRWIQDEYTDGWWLSQKFMDACADKMKCISEDVIGCKYPDAENVVVLCGGYYMHNDDCILSIKVYWFKPESDIHVNSRETGWIHLPVESNEYVVSHEDIMEELSLTIGRNIDDWEE